jgi:hypothetical protein
VDRCDVKSAILAKRAEHVALVYSTLIGLLLEEHHPHLCARK